MFAENVTLVLSRVTNLDGGTLGRRPWRVVNRDGEVFEQAGLLWEEEQLRLVELEVVERHPS